MSNAGTRARHRGADASWVAIGATSIAALVACALPAFRIGLDAYIGAGNRQRSFLYDREVTLADLLPWSLLIPAAALLLLGTSAAALCWGSRAWLVLPACTVALVSLPAIVDVDDRLGGGPHGVMGFEKPHGGPLLQPALDDLTADARRSPEARDSGWRLLGGEHSYRATGLVGWWLLERLAIVLSLLTAYRAFRLSMRPWPAVGATTAAALILLGWLFVRSLSHLE